MIKLKQVATDLGECVLTFEFDHEGNTYTVDIHERDIIERLRLLRRVLGRKLTVQDLKDVIIKIINEIRERKESLEGRFDYSQLIDVDLEAEG